MVVEARPRIIEAPAPAGRKESSKTRITLFSCFNAVSNVRSVDNTDVEVENIKLPCSSMTRESVLLRAFEAGADAVLVLVCPLGGCRHLDGNIRAAKRVERMKTLLDQIGIDGRRLNLFNVTVDDPAAVDRLIARTVSELAELGPNPANRN
jgi:F420-non-reducing hydrogenase iron-sulfur subunit